MTSSSTDEEIGAEVRQRANDFCAALNAAGRAGLLIDVHFSNSSIASLADGTIQRTGWRSGTSLKRVQYV